VPVDLDKRPPPSRAPGRRPRPPCPRSPLRRRLAGGGPGQLRARSIIGRPEHVIPGRPGAGSWPVRRCAGRNDQTIPVQRPPVVDLEQTLGEIQGGGVGTEQPRCVEVGRLGGASCRTVRCPSNPAARSS
jgi:hypothetical protein